MAMPLAIDPVVRGEIGLHRQVAFRANRLFTTTVGPNLAPQRRKRQFVCGKWGLAARIDQGIELQRLGGSLHWPMIDSRDTSISS